MNHARTDEVGGEIPYPIAIGPGVVGDGDALAIGGNAFGPYQKLSAVAKPSVVPARFAANTMVLDSGLATLPVAPLQLLLPIPRVTE